MRSTTLTTVLLLALVALSTVTSQRYGIKRPSYVTEPTTKSVAGGAPLTYNGGPLITTTFTINYIWYGAWDPNGLGVLLAENFAANVDSTEWYRPTQLLKDANGTRVTGDVRMGTSVFDTGSLGLSLSETNIIDLVVNAINAGKLAYDAASLTLVISAPNVDVAGYCNGKQDDACGYHTTTDRLSQGLIQLGFIGAKSLECGCSPDAGPYGESLDGMMDTIAHEIIETASDPVPSTGWINEDEKDTSENGDKCANKYENKAPYGNDTFYNLIAGGRKYIIQPNYNVDTNMCDTPCVPEAVNLATSDCPAVVTIPGTPVQPPVPAPPRASPTGSCSASTESACIAVTGCIWKGGGRCQFNCKSLNVAAGEAACVAKGCRFNPKKGCRQLF